ncbi:MAG: esterase-like activity of phytase family protein [Chloroflexota bacterium]
MSRFRALFVSFAVAASVVVGIPWSASAQSSPLRLLGEYSFESKRMYQDTTLGGLSGITYDAKRGVYYLVSDDRGENQPARFYTARITLSMTGISNVEFIGVTTLDSDANTPGIQPYEKNDLDLEDIALLPDDTLLITSERDLKPQPWIRRFGLDGSLLGELPVPDKFKTVNQPGPDGRPQTVKGTRNNLGFEGLALNPEGNAFYTANEEALAQDGPIASLEAGTNIRVVKYEQHGTAWHPGNEWVYRTEKIFSATNPVGQFADNGVSGMLYVKHLLPQFDFLAMERSFATGVGNDVNIYGVTIGEAPNVAAQDALPSPYTGRAVQKTLLVNMAKVGVSADNLEGMTLGPRLPNGKQSLIVISDDNFSAFDPPQINQFLLFEVDAGTTK